MICLRLSASEEKYWCRVDQMNTVRVMRVPSRSKQISLMFEVTFSAICIALIGE